MTPKTYKFKTFQELFDRVPADKIELCMTEFGKALAMAKKPFEIAANLTKMDLSKVVSITLPEELEWIDDGKGEIKATLHLPTGDEVHLKDSNFSL